MLSNNLTSNSDLKLMGLISLFHGLTTCLLIETVVSNIVAHVSISPHHIFWRIVILPLNFAVLVVLAAYKTIF